MRSGVLILTLVAVLLGSSFWYAQLASGCVVPIRYRIGTIDERFAITPEEFQRIARAAEAVWEEPLKEELFVYDAQAALALNLVFDERQERANEEEELRQDLIAKEGMSEAVAEQYEALIDEFRTLRDEYETRVVRYESELRAYNNEVSALNAQGGVSEEQFDALEAEAASLEKERAALETFAKQLNALIDDLNRIGARGNTLIADYNTIVEEYNDRFAEVHEFAQGDYKRGAINVYAFNSPEELTVVLAHEFGHALSLDRVSDRSAIMHERMDAQRLAKGVTQDDTAEYLRVCADPGTLTRVARWFWALVSF